MFISLSRAYIYMFVPLILLLIAILLVFHMAMMLGSHYEPNGRLFVVWFGINLPILSLAEHRNIWANEVKQCPLWLRATLPILFAYSFIVAILGIFFRDMHEPNTFFSVFSAFMLTFTCGCSCVLWVAVQSAKRNPIELRQRTTRSISSIAIFFVFYLLFAFLPATTLHQ